MAPNITSVPNITGVLYEDDNVEDIKVKGTEPESESEKETPLQPSWPFKTAIVWRNVIIFAYLHIAAVYGAYLMFTSAKLATTLYAFFLYQISGLGITGGAHRLWSHRAYKAKLPLRILLTLFNTLAFQNSVIEWSRDHRVHHKYTETDADPHNLMRGVFFAHVGWLLVKKHPEVIKRGKGIDMSDLKNDPVLAFQQKYYLIVMPIVCFLIPTLIPVYCWGETWTNAWFVGTILRYVWTLNMTWLVNSAAHKWGSRPYDKGMMPSENLAVAVGALGEGWHNYHHVFPWDYKAAELGNYRANLTTAFINLMAKIGWAYDLKTVPASMIKSRVERTGDGSHEIWGWGDKDMPKEEMEQASTLHKKAD